MASPNIQAMLKAPFIPQKPKIVSIGRMSVSLYRKVDETMSDLEKALAFQHNRTGLAGANLDQRARILTLANQMNLMLMAEAGLADWERKLSKNWSNFQYLKILSWHDEKGTRISNTTIPGDSSILLPVQDGNIADCCSPGGIRKKNYCVHEKLLHILHHTHPPDPLPPTIVQWCIVLSRSAIGVVVVVIVAMVVAAAAVTPSFLPTAPPNRQLLCCRRHCPPPPLPPPTGCWRHQLPRGWAPLLALPFPASTMAHP